MSINDQKKIHIWNILLHFFNCVHINCIVYVDVSSLQINSHVSYVEMSLSLI